MYVYECIIKKNIYKNIEGKIRNMIAYTKIAA